MSDKGLSPSPCDEVGKEIKVWKSVSDTLSILKDVHGVFLQSQQFIIPRIRVFVTILCNTNEKHVKILYAKILRACNI